jgi:hypothetical protein
VILSIECGQELKRYFHNLQVMILAASLWLASVSAALGAPRPPLPQEAPELRKSPTYSTAEITNWLLLLASQYFESHPDSLSGRILLARAEIAQGKYTAAYDRLRKTLERGRRSWKGKAEEQAAVYANRRRIRGERGKRLLRQRGEKIERSFAHLYETGGMRRVHLRRYPNILKRLLVHVAAFNLGLVMRKLFGKGTPRGLQDYGAALFFAFCSA